MFYKKNNAKQLDKALFENPTCEYRGAPFWSWNCKITKELIDYQINIYHQMGVGGFTIHPRTGLETEYMSEEFLELVEYCNERAKELGMYCYLYDEDRYASGAAGGMVTENVRFRQRSMFLTQNIPVELDNTKEEYEAMIEAGERPKGYYLTSYNVVLDEKGCLKSYRQIQKDENVNEGKKWHAFVKIAKESPWFNDQTYIDVFNEEAVSYFIKVTHEKYYDKLGKDFGNSVPSIFTDEPQMAGKFAFATPFDDKDATLSYTDDMDDTFKEAYGISLLSVVPEILWELPNNEVSVNRYNYHNHLSERFTKSFPDNIAKWCDEHNLMLTGHFMSERTLYSQTLALSEAMRLYKSMQMPGIDILCDQKEFTTAKQAVSVARQQGREGVACELYGVTEWDADFKTYKLQGDWLAALGITHRVHHLTFMSMEGEAKRDWPASIGYQAPFYPEYHMVEDYFARVNSVLTRGSANVNVAVIHPIESYWMSYGPNSQTQTIRDQLDENFENLTQWLLYGTVDFDFICEGLFEEFTKEMPNSDVLHVGKMNYRAVLVPDLITLRSTTMDRLEAFADAGGTVIFAGNIPKYVDAQKSERAINLAKKCKCIQLNRAEVLSALDFVRDIEIYDGKGKLSSNLFYQMRNDNDDKWLFVCHVNRKRNLLQKHEKYFITVKGVYKPVLYDAQTGEIRDYDMVEVVNGNTRIKVHLFAQDSVLFKLLPQIPQKVIAPVTYKYDTVQINRPQSYTLNEPNALLLDYAEYKFDDGEWQPKNEILKIDNEFRQLLGLPRRQDHFTQPYRIANVQPKNEVTLRYTFESEIEVSNCQYAMERPENAVIIFNGQEIKTDKTYTNTWENYYVDCCITKVNLPLIKKGKNELIVKIPFGRKVNLEWSYILGDFGVNVLGTHSYITKRAKNLYFGDITNQTLPFYTGNVNYEFTLALEKDAEDVVIEIPHFKAPVIALHVDGEQKTLVAYAPHKGSLGSLKAGLHKVVLELYGNRFNGFGTVHNADDEFKWYGPDSYRTKNSQWSDTYQLRENGILSPVNVLISK